MAQLPPVTYPQSLDAFILHHARVHAIAHQKYNTTVNRLLQHPVVQEWMGDRHLSQRCELEANDWQALADHLQRKSIKAQILEPQNV